MYNSKTAEYRSYDADDGLANYGKVYGIEIDHIKKSWNYGYFGVGDYSVSNNQPYADLAKADITYIEN